MSESDHVRRSEELEREARELERHSEEIHRQAQEARADWERKRADADVPGAPPPEDGEEDAPAQTETPPW